VFSAFVALQTPEGYLVVKPGFSAHPGRFHAVGGKSKDGETADQCVMRETLEKTGLELQPPRLRRVGHVLPQKADEWEVFYYRYILTVNERLKLLPVMHMLQTVKFEEVLRFVNNRTPRTHALDGLLGCLWEARA